MYIILSGGNTSRETGGGSWDILHGNVYGVPTEARGVRNQGK